MDLLNEKRTKFPKDNKIDLFLCLIEHYKILNATQASYAIRRMVQFNDVGLLDRVYEEYYLKIIERKMIDNEDFDERKVAQVGKYYEYTNELRSFEECLENCAKIHIQFWKLMLDNHPDIESL